MTEILPMVYKLLSINQDTTSIHMYYYLPCSNNFSIIITLSLTSADIGMGRAAAYAYCDPVIVQDSGGEYRDSMVKVMRFP